MFISCFYLLIYFFYFLLFIYFCINDFKIVMIPFFQRCIQYLIGENLKISYQFKSYSLVVLVKEWNKTYKIDRCLVLLPKHTFTLFKTLPHLWRAGSFQEVVLFQTPLLISRQLWLLQTFSNVRTRRQKDKQKPQTLNCITNNRKTFTISFFVAFFTFPVLSSTPFCLFGFPLPSFRPKHLPIELQREAKERTPGGLLCFSPLQKHSPFGHSWDAGPWSGG